MTLSSQQNILQEMDAALAFEIQAQEESNYKSGKHIAINGKSVEEKNGLLHLYEFSLENPWEAADDTPVRVLVQPKQAINATIVRSNGLTITIGTKEPLLPEALRQITLFDDSVELLKRLREMLQKNQEGPTRLGSKAFGIEPFRVGKVTQSPSPQFDKCNTPQQQAITTALGSEVTYIIGPPGTGKTFTLALITLNHILANRSVLIVSHTNIAVDNAITGITDLREDANNIFKQRLKEGKIIRYGASRNNDLKKPEYEDIYLPAIVKRKSAHLARQLEELNRSLQQRESQYMSQLKPIELEHKIWTTQQHQIISQLEPAKQELRRLRAIEEQRKAALTAQKRQKEKEHKEESQNSTANEQLMAKKLTEIVRNASEGEKLVAQRNDLSTQLAAAQQMNKIARMFKGIHLESLSKRLSDVGYQIWQIEENQTTIQAALTVAYSKRAAYEKSLGRIAAELQITDHQLHTPTRETLMIGELQARVYNQERRLPEIDTKLNVIEQSMNELEREYQRSTAVLRDQIATIVEQLREVETQVVAEAQVIATTLSKTYMSQALNERHFDVVIVDEISMAPLPAVYFAASHADHSFVAIGDPQQLAPIVNDKDRKHPLVGKWLGIDLFTHRKITLEKSIRGFENSVLLQYQFRMHPEISSISSAHVYRGHILDSKGIGVEKVLKIEPEPDKHLVLCDTSDASPIASKPQSSRINVYHALCAIALARQVLLSLPYDSKQPDKQRIGIVAPYSKQAKLLLNLIKDAGLENLVKAGTVHRFQGLEFDVVIFDTVELPPIPPPKDFIAVGNEAMRLVNVAITRAKHKLIIIANANHILTSHKGNEGLSFPLDSTLRKAVEEAKKVGIVNSFEILEQPLATFEAKQDRYREIVKLQSLLDNTTKLDPELLYEERLNEVTFFPRFAQDLQDARSKIVIVSPFIANRAYEILPILERKLKESVSVIVVTDPDEYFEQSPKIEELFKKAGIEILHYPKAHMKHAIIDEKIIYDGSLNILSHKDRHESMNS